MLTSEQDAHAAYPSDQLPTPSHSVYTNGTSYHIPDNGSNATLHDASGGSDTDSSRPDGARSSQADGSNAAKKATFRPVSFAKFSVNKVAATTPGVKTVTDKGEDLFSRTMDYGKLTKFSSYASQLTKHFSASWFATSPCRENRKWP